MSIIVTLLSIGISAAIAFLVSHAMLSSKLGRIEERSDLNRNRMDRLETKLDNFFFAALASPEKIQEAMQNQLRPVIAKFNNILSFLEKKKNPLSLEQINKLKAYRDKLTHGLPLKPDEYRDFQFLVKEISKELPKKEKEEFDWVAAGLLGFIAGLIIGSLIKK